MSDLILITPEALKGMREERAILAAHRDALMKERDELLNALRLMREQSDTYWMKEVCEVADTVLAKYPP
jgi:hypothetical protein